MLFCDMLAVNVSVVLVAPEMSLKVAPPSVLTCHCTVGAGEPVAAALNDADCPDVTVVLDGEDVTVSIGQEEVEVDVAVGVLPLVVFVTGKSCGSAVTTIAVVAMQPWLSVRVRVKLSVAGAVSACSCDSLT